MLPAATSCSMRLPEMRARAVDQRDLAPCLRLPERVAEPGRELEPARAAADDDDRGAARHGADRRPACARLAATVSASRRCRSATLRRGSGHVRFRAIEHLFRLLGLDVGFLVEHAIHPRRVQFTAPLSDDDRGDAVADEVGDRARLGHEAVDAEDQRQAGDRNVADGGQASPPAR